MLLRPLLLLLLLLLVPSVLCLKPEMLLLLGLLLLQRLLLLLLLRLILLPWLLCRAPAAADALIPVTGAFNPAAAAAAAGISVVAGAVAVAAPAAAGTPAVPDVAPAVAVAIAAAAAPALSTPQSAGPHQPPQVLTQCQTCRHVTESDELRTVPGIPPFRLGQWDIMPTKRQYADCLFSPFYPITMVLMNALLVKEFAVTYMTRGSAA